MTRREVALVVAVLASACGGGATTAPEPRPGLQPPAPRPPGPHDNKCYWAGRLTATIAPMHGDATCFAARPLDVELRHEEWGRRGGAGGDDTHFGLVIEDPPAAVGTGADGVRVTVNGSVDACPASIGLAYTFPEDNNRSLFVHVQVTQDPTTHRVAGRGGATMFCADDQCRCDASVLLDGVIAFN